MSYLWTSEAVAAGHPDKVADQIADAVLDANLKLDCEARVACEVTLTTGLAFVTGEVSSQSPLAKQELATVVRNTICGIGYDRDENSFNGKTIDLFLHMKEQSTEIAKAVSRDGSELGAGDQGIMFGYACNETPNYMPFTHWLSFRAIELIEQDIAKNRTADEWTSPFLPDAKSQVTAVYSDSGYPLSVDTVLISVCHRSDVSLNDLQFYVNQRVIAPLIEQAAITGCNIDEKTKILINPAGQWNIGGPASDTGLSGRKIVVDNYGADCPVGGGSFSGKDPTKVDRSAAYAARFVAKNIVAAGLAKKCQVQLAYAIGVVEPVSLRIQTFGTLDPNCGYTEITLSEKIRSLVSFTPKAIIDRFNLRSPIYQKTASGGHFGNGSFPWEKLSLVLELIR